MTFGSQRAHAAELVRSAAWDADYYARAASLAAWDADIAYADAVRAAYDVRRYRAADAERVARFARMRHDARVMRANALADIADRAAEREAWAQARERDAWRDARAAGYAEPYAYAWMTRAERSRRDIARARKLRARSMAHAEWDAAWARPLTPCDTRPYLTDAAGAERRAELTRAALAYADALANLAAWERAAVRSHGRGADLAHAAERAAWRADLASRAAERALTRAERGA